MFLVLPVFSFEICPVKTALKLKEHNILDIMQSVFPKKRKRISLRETAESRVNTSYINVELENF